MKAIVNGTLYTPAETIDAGVVLIADRVIQAVGSQSSTPIPPGAEVIDAQGQAVIPGLIDIHTYGNLGVAITSPENVAQELPAFAHNVVRFGVTSFLISPTMGDRALLTRELAALAAAIPETLNAAAGAQPIGVHLEGPWLDPEQKGAFPREVLHAPSVDEAREYVAACGGYLRLVTLAPNLPHALETAHWLRENGVLASVGHTNTTYEFARDVLASPDWPLITHVYNAMSGLHHRKPGVLGAVLSSDHAIGMLIGDGLHAHPAAVKILLRALGPERVILVTDAIAGAGLGEGTFTMLNRSVRVVNGIALLPDGTIAGSILTLNRAVMNAKTFGALSLNDALRMATANPARVLGLTDRGRLAPGLQADVAVMDAHGQVSLTMVAGNVVYSS